MGKKDKKKRGLGAEKTAAKTEKKSMQRAKKELVAQGEDNIEMMIAEYQEKNESQQSYVGEERSEPPSPRSSFTFCAHPDKDELILFGGEYFNGSKTSMYNDLYLYNIKKNQWSILRCSNKPPPRCSHQAVTTSQGGGQMWVFGGEFASPSRSNFYHYNDLWVYHIAEKRWEQCKAPGGPSARSGHRMVLNRKRIILFGGFRESIRDHTQFNDVHVFDLESYKWTKIEPSGKGPSPRSGCQMASLSDGRVLLHGGYVREKLKKEAEKGMAQCDMYHLQLDEKSGVPKWKWVAVRQSGVQPSPRSGFAIAVATGNRAFLFGGVQDQEDTEEELSGLFHNDLHALELEKGRWLPITLRTQGEIGERKRRRKAKGNDDSDEECAMEDLSIEDEPKIEVKTSEDNIFTLRIASSSASQAVGDVSSSVMPPTVDGSQPFRPHPRMKAGMVIKHSILYLYGGICEDGDRQLTFSDFYSYDVHKMNEWHTIIAPNFENIEWIESSSDSEREDSDEDEEDSSEDGMDTS